MGMMQSNLFGFTEIKDNKSYRAIRHDIVRDKQKNNENEVHHPDHKIKQIKKVLAEFAGWCDKSTLELFSGHGNCTKIYAEYGEVIANELKANVFLKLKENTKDLMLVHCNKVDSFLFYHELIALKQKFDIIDIDSYGFPNRFFPDIFLLIDNGYMFITMPKPYVNILNGITETHLISYYGERNPSYEKIIERIVLWGLCHWRKIEIIDCVDCKSIWRIAIKVTKVKATEYTGIKNR
jgi:tRNA G26 N,N-dimethylase Trm1